MDKWVTRILCILTMLVFLLIFLQEKTHFVHMKKLDGVVEEVAFPKFTMKDYSDREYQNNLENYSKRNFGFREWAIRCYNQYLWDFYGKTSVLDISVGNDGWLYEPWFVDDYYQSRMYKYTDDPEVMKEKYRTEAYRLFKIQKILEEFGVTLFVMIEPGKDRVYPEHLPNGDKYTQPMGVKAADYYPYLFDSLGVNYVNFSKYFVEQKGKVDYPLFPQTGTHWSNIASVYAADSLFRYMEHIGKKNIHNISIGPAYYDKTRKPDDDLEKMMNLIREIPKVPNMYADVSVVEDTSAVKPRLITIGDSFFWNIANEVPLDSIFSECQYWYYNSTIYFNPNFTSTSEIDLATELLGADYVMLSYCTAMIYDIGNGFNTNALVHLCYDDAQINAVLGGIMASMKNDENWMASLVEKANLQGRELEDVMLGDAKYMLFSNPENYFDELRGSGVPQVRNKDIYIKQIKKKIYGYPMWLDSVRADAERWNVSLDSAVTRNAIWYYNQNKSE